MVTQHVFVRRKQSQWVANAPGTSGQAESSTFGARASPQVTPPSFTRRRHDSLSDASSSPSSHRRQYSPVPPHMDDIVVPVPPLTDDVADLVPPPESEADADGEPKAFR